MVYIANPSEGNMTEKKILTLTEVAEHLGINKRKLYRMLNDRSFDVKPIPKTSPRLWNKEDIDTWRKGK